MFFLLLALIGLVCRPSPKKPANQGGQRKDSSEGAAPGPLWKQAGEGEEAENAEQSKGFGNINQGARGPRHRVSQAERWRQGIPTEGQAGIGAD